MTASIALNDILHELYAENQRLCNELKVSHNLCQNYRQLTHQCLQSCVNCQSNAQYVHHFNQLELSYPVDDTQDSHAGSDDQGIRGGSDKPGVKYVYNIGIDESANNELLISVKEVLISDSNCGDNHGVRDAIGGTAAAVSQPIGRRSSRRTTTKSKGKASEGSTRPPDTPKVDTTVEKKKECDFCDYTHRDWKAVESHMNRWHLNLKPYRCLSCGVSYSSDRYLTRHIKESHNSVIKYFRCDYKDCDFKTKYQNAIKEHKLRHTGNKPFQCLWPSCENRFYTNSELNSHILSHNDLRSFHCTWPGCDHKTKTVSNLRKHMDYHTADPSIKKFKCKWPGCKSSFSRKNGLSVHSLRHTKEKKFVCDWDGCSKRFLVGEALRRHMSYHRAERPYRCTWEGCEKAFTEKSNMQKHFARHKEV